MRMTKDEKQKARYWRAQLYLYPVSVHCSLFCDHFNLIIHVFSDDIVPSFIHYYGTSAVLY